MSIIESSLLDHKNIHVELKRVTSPQKRNIQYEACDCLKVYKILEPTVLNKYDLKAKGIYWHKQSRKPKKNTFMGNSKNL